MTPKQLTAKEDAILDSLVDASADRTFRRNLYRDGVPSPASYLSQDVRVLFAFREPNLSGAPHPHDMRDEVRDPRFRPLREGRRVEASRAGWWNSRAGMFAHAVAAALEGTPSDASYRQFRAVIEEGQWHHEVVNRFGYLQIKKIGGGGSANCSEIREFAKRYCDTLAAQIALYRPHLLIGCGVGADSPAALLRTYVLLGGRTASTQQSEATWWSFSRQSRPIAMIQAYHPSARGSRLALYRDLWLSVREVAAITGLSTVRGSKAGALRVGRSAD